MSQQTVKGYKGLLAFLKNQGYAGKGDLGSVRKFIETNGIEGIDDDALASAHKQYMAADVTANDDGTMSIVLMPESEDGDKMDGEDYEDKPETESKAAKYREANRIAQYEKRVAALEEGYKAIKPTVTGGDIPGEAKWRAKNRSGKTVFSSAKAAYDFGNYWLASSPYIANQYPQHAERGRKALSGMGYKANATFPNADGGVLVAEQFLADIVNYQDEFGEARRLLRNIPMTSDQLRFPRYVGGISAAWIGEGESITESDGEFNDIKLVAKKLAAYVLVSSELMADSSILIAEFIAGEMARQAAKKEDLALFQGDGTSTYGGIVGLEGKMGAYSGSDVRHVQATNTSSSSSSFGFTLADLARAKGKIKRIHRDANLAWVTSPTGQAAIFGNLAQSAGGVTYQESRDGTAYVPIFLGLPVVTVGEDLIDTSTAAGTIVAYCANLNNAGVFGDRSRADIQTSNDYAFKSDQVAIRMTERVDINLHDVGTSSAAETVVALYTK